MTLHPSRILSKLCKYKTEMSKKYVVVGDQPADSPKMSPDGTKKPSDEKMAASGVAMMHPSALEESTGNNMEERNKGKHTVTKGNYANMMKAEHLAAMKSCITESQNKGNRIRVNVVEIPSSKDLVVNFEVLDEKGELHWQFKPDIVAEVTASVAQDIPGIYMDFFGNLHVGKPRMVPHSDDEVCKNAKNYPVTAMWGTLPHRLFALESHETAGMVVKQVKKLFGNSDFQEFYLAALAVSYEKIVPHLQRNRDNDLWKAMQSAASDPKLKVSLDAFYMNKTIYNIAKAVWPDKQPVDWNMDEKCFTFHDGNVPASILSL